MLTKVSRRILFPKKVVKLPFHDIESTRSYSFWFTGNNDNGFQQAINNAEKLVGYPTSLSTLKYLLDEEPANFLPLAKKLVGSGHPLLNTAKNILSHDSYNNYQLGGLWVLLLSKASYNNDNKFMEDDIVYGIHQKQRTLSETTELINIALLIHRSMLDLESNEYIKDLNKKTLKFGNNLSILGGDFLLAKASAELAKLSDAYVVEMLSQAIGDLSHGASLENLTNNIHWNIKDWEHFVYLLKGSLMAHGCKSALVLNETSDQRQQENAFQFGKNLVLAQQVAEDIESFQKKEQLVKRTNILLILAFQKNKDLQEKYSNPSGNDMLSFSREIKQDIEDVSPDIVQDVRKLREVYIEQCKYNIAFFPHKETVNAINCILDTICES